MTPTAFAPVGTTWPTVADFYDAAPRELRRLSGEMDFGVWWTDSERVLYPTIRVSVVQETGEVIAVMGRSGGLVPEEGPVELLGRVHDVPTDLVYETIERALKGWPDHCRPGGLPWVRDQLAAAGYR